jgi:acetoin utilization protein AcuC
VTGPAGVALVWDPALARYDFGPEHPLAPVRVELTVALIEALGLVADQAVRKVPPGPYDEDELLRLHRPAFVAAVRRASADPSIRTDLAHGLGPGDNPIFRDMHAASMAVCAASKEAARVVWEGEAAHSFNPAGGLHHAMPDRAAGFCIYNDPAVAIDWLLEHGAERVCYLDVDVHHGDGVQAMFIDDPRVLTISLHESGRFLFPGTGFPDEIGGPGAEGSSVNLPFHPGTTGPIWLEAFDEVVVPLVAAFAPDVLVTQLGCDTHATDPLAHLAFRMDDYRALGGRIHELAHAAAGGRWIATGGGGYQLVQVVPRAWATMFAEMVGADAPTGVPEPWRQLAHERTRHEAPADFDDPRLVLQEGVEKQVRRAADEAVDAVRRLILPRHGIPA